jgi:hypothetical protein
VPRRPATTDERRQLARLARPHPVWIAISAAWTAATLLLIVLGLYYVVTGARTLGQSLFVLLVGVGGLAGYLYLRRLFARAAASDRASGQRDLEAGEVDETRFEIVDAIEVAVTVIRAPSSGLVLAVRPDGKFLAPSTVRPSFSDRDRARGRAPEDGEIVETDFERLRGRA